MIAWCLPKISEKSKRVLIRLILCSKATEYSLFKLVFTQIMLIPLLNCFISVSDQDSELYPQFSMGIDIPEIETECSLSETNESFNIYENAQMKKAKYANKHFLKIFEYQIKI